MLTDLREFAAITLLAIGALLPIVDPLGGAPIYLAMSVVVRLSAFILLCIGVQIVWNGVHALLAGAFPGLR
jgi:multiple antibiotic resistance protein